MKNALPPAGIMNTQAVLVPNVENYTFKGREQGENSNIKDYVLRWSWRAGERLTAS